MTWILSDSSLERRTGIDKRLIEINDLALSICSIDFGIPEYGGLRSVQEQKSLCDKDLSKCDGTVHISKHQNGKALDFYAYVDGKASWEEIHLSLVAAAHLQAACRLGYKIVWGGFFKSFVDMPHIQLE